MRLDSGAIVKREPSSLLITSSSNRSSWGPMSTRTRAPPRGSGTDGPLTPCQMAQARGADWQFVSRPERSSSERTHAAGKAGGTTAEHRREIETSTHGERCAGARSTTDEAKRRAIRQIETLLRVDRGSIDGHDELRTRDGTHDIAGSLHFRTEDRQFECSGGVGISGQTVGAPMGIDVHRARHWNTARLVSPPAKVLHRGQHPGPEHFQRCHSRCASSNSARVTE